MSTLSRIACPKCGTECMELEMSCWQCGSNLRPKPVREPEPTDGDSPIRFDGMFAEAKPETAVKTLTTLTGEVVEVTDIPAPAASIGDTEIAAKPEEAVMVLTFCKGCGLQNEEGLRECAKCKKPLEIVAVSSFKEMELLPRAWGFDVLGAAWIVLGFAAIWAGQFLLRTDPDHSGTTWADYFWTGIVVCAPGILIFMRHVACKVLFWVMTLGSILVWSVIGFIWLYVGLRTSQNNEVGLGWLALLSTLSAISYFTVRTNDAFDYSL